MQTSYIKVKGQQLRLSIKGCSSTRRSPPLLLCNGLGANLEVFEPLLSELTSLEVILFDVPGVGGSPAPTKPYRIGSLARLVRDLLDELGVGQVDVLGFSWGGALAQQLSLDYPQLCRRLVLAATGPGIFMLPGKPSALLPMLKPKRFLDSNYLLNLAGTLYGGALRSKPEILLQKSGMMIPPQDKGYLLQLLAILGWTSAHRLRRLEQPTLLMYGTDDPIVRALNSHIMRWLIPEARVEFFDCGHLFLITQSRLAAPVLEEFLLLPNIA